MAEVKISKWEVAEMFGLEYHGETDWDSHRCCSWYKFGLSTGQQFSIEHNGYDAENEEQAKERAAEKVLEALGRLIVV